MCDCAECSSLKCCCETGHNNAGSNESFVTFPDGDGFNLRFFLGRVVTRRRMYLAGLFIAVFFVGFLCSMFVAPRDDDDR